MSTAYPAPVAAPIDLVALRESVADLLVSRCEEIAGEGSDLFANLIDGVLNDCLDLFDEATGTVFWLVSDLDDSGCLTGWGVGCPTGALVPLPELEEKNGPGLDDVSVDAGPMVDALMSCLTATRESVKAAADAQIEADRARACA